MFTLSLDPTLRRLSAAAMLLFTLAACDGVPEQSVELSVTVGRDIEAVQRSHVAMANALLRHRPESVAPSERRPRHR